MLCQTETVMNITSSQTSGMSTNAAEGPQVWDSESDDHPRDEFSELGLRSEIHLSWRRSRQALAPMDRMDVPYVELDDDDHRLLRALEPVLARFAEHLTDTRFSLVLADQDGRVVHTWAGEDKVRRHLSSLSIDSGFLLSEGCAGTNGIGTVLEEGRPVLVIGDEHYSEPLRQLTCAGTPIRNPITRRLAGVLDLACPRGEWSKLGSPALAQLRHDLEEQLAAKASLTQRLLFERFTARCRETSAPVVGVSDRYMITNAAATDLLSAADQGVIWTALSRGGEAGGVQRITLSNGCIIDAKSQVIRLGGSIGGHLIELASRAHDNQPRRRRRRVPTTVESTLDDIVRANPQRLLILGEPGVGKRTAAQQLHQRINGNNPIVMVSCELSRVADGQRWLGELAAHLQQTEDTVVLRHLDLLTEPVAKTVVALLERSKAGPRIIATASHDFADNSWNGALREVLGELTLSLPPLRDRRPELGTLAAATLRDIDPALHVSGRALAALHNYDWPGNFAQLRGVMAQSAKTAGGQVIGLEHLPREIADTLRGPQALSRIEELEREAIITALREQRGNKVRAAKALGMSRSTFYRRLRQLRLDPSALLS